MPQAVALGRRPPEPRRPPRALPTGWGRQRTPRRSRRRSRRRLRRSCRRRGLRPRLPRRRRQTPGVPGLDISSRECFFWSSDHRRPIFAGFATEKSRGCDSWFTGWFHHLPGPCISLKRTPLVSTGEGSTNIQLVFYFMQNHWFLPQASRVLSMCLKTGVSVYVLTP